MYLDDAQGVFRESADLAAGEEDRSLQLRLFWVACCGDGESLLVVAEKHVQGLVGLAGAAAAVFGEGQGGLRHRGRCSAPNRPPAASAL